MVQVTVRLMQEQQLLQVLLNILRQLTADCVGRFVQPPATAVMMPELAQWQYEREFMYRITCYRRVLSDINTAIHHRPVAKRLVMEHDLLVGRFLATAAAMQVEHTLNLDFRTAVVVCDLCRKRASSMHGVLYKLARVPSPHFNLCNVDVVSVVPSCSAAIASQHTTRK